MRAGKSAGRPVHPPLGERNGASVWREVDHPEVAERGVRVDRLALYERALPVLSHLLPREGCIAWLVFALQPLPHDLVAASPGLPERRRVVRGIVGEERADVV